MKISKLTKFMVQKREESGLTQAQVAAALGYTSSQFISNWERGLANPPAFVLKDLAKLYKCRAEELFELLLNDVEESLRKEFVRGSRR